jgi:hypothetical protein
MIKVMSKARFGADRASREIRKCARGREESGRRGSKHFVQAGGMGGTNERLVAEPCNFAWAAVAAIDEASRSACPRLGPTAADAEQTIGDARRSVCSMPSASYCR